MRSKNGWWGHVLDLESCLYMWTMNEGGASFPYYAVLLAVFDENTLGYKVDVCAQWDDPSGNGYDIAVPGLVVDRFQHFSYVIGDGGVVPILGNGFEVFLRGICVKVRGSSHSNDAVDFIRELLFTANRGEGGHDGINISVCSGAFSPLYLLTIGRSKL